MVAHVWTQNTKSRDKLSRELRVLCIPDTVLSTQMAPHKKKTHQRGTLKLSQARRNGGKISEDQSASSELGTRSQTRPSCSQGPGFFIWTSARCKQIRDTRQVDGSGAFRPSFENKTVLGPMHAHGNLKCRGEWHLGPKTQTLSTPPFFWPLANSKNTPSFPSRDAFRLLASIRIHPPIHSSHIPFLCTANEHIA